jgi:hypothetical protein
MILWSFVGAAPFTAFSSNENQVVTRYDRVLSDDKTKSILTHQFVANQFQTVKSTEKKILKALSAEESFKVDLTCDSSVSRTVCGQVLVGLQNAGLRIAGVLKMNKQITIKAQYYPFCPANNKNCDRASSLGGAVYGSSFVVKKDNQFFMHSQGLLKQLNTDVKLPTSQYDVLAEFNADVNWYFRGGSATAISSIETDFEYVTTHEMYLFDLYIALMDLDLEVASLNILQCWIVL